MPDSPAPSNPPHPPARRHLAWVAGAFRLAGWLLGLPALAATLYIGSGWVFLLMRPTPDNAPPLDVQSGGVPALLNNGAQSAEHVLDFLLGMGARLLGAATLAALLLTLLAGALLLIARGLARRRAWARVAGLLAGAFVLLLSLIALTSLPALAAPFALVPGAAAGYVVWVLGWGFGVG